MTTACDLYNFGRPGEYNVWKAWWTSPEMKLSYFRPLAGILLCVEFQLWGRNPVFYHLDTILFYFLCIMLLYKLAADIFNSQWPGFFVAAVFSVSPAHMTNIQWTANRVDILCSLGMLAGFVLYLKGFRSSDKSFKYPLMVGLCFIGGLFSKESALIFIPALPLYHLYLYWTDCEKCEETACDKRTGMLIRSLSIVLLTAAAWMVLYFTGDYGIRSGYCITADTPADIAFAHMLKAFMLYMGDLFFHVKALEVSKNKMFGVSLINFLLLFAGWLFIIFLVCRILGKRGIVLTLLLFLFLLPALPFRVSDRLCFISVIWTAMIGGSLIDYAFSRNRRVWVRILIVAVITGWWIGGGIVYSVKRSLDREEWCRRYPERLLEETAEIIEENPGARVIFYMNLPNPLLCMSLTDSLCWHLNRNDIHAYALTTFNGPPQIMIRGSRKFHLRSKFGKPFFTSMAEQIFMTADALKEKKEYAVPHFFAEISQTNLGDVQEVAYTLRKAARHSDYLFIVWGDRYPQRARQFTFSKSR